MSDPAAHSPQVRAVSRGAASEPGVWERKTHVGLTEALADVWGQEAFLQPGGQIACGARNINAGVSAGTPDPQMTRLYFRLRCCPPWTHGRLGGQALVSGQEGEP